MSSASKAPRGRARLLQARKKGLHATDSGKIGHTHQELCQIVIMMMIMIMMTLKQSLGRADNWDRPNTTFYSNRCYICLLQRKTSLQGHIEQTKLVQSSSASERVESVCLNQYRLHVTACGHQNHCSVPIVGVKNTVGKRCSNHVSSYETNQIKSNEEN